MIFWFRQFPKDNLSFALRTFSSESLALSAFYLTSAHLLLPMKTDVVDPGAGHIGANSVVRQIIHHCFHRHLLINLTIESVSNVATGIGVDSYFVSRS